MSKDKKVVHRVVEVTKDGYRTKGDANENVDVKEITKDIYYGKCIFYLPYAGFIVMAFQSDFGKIGLVIILILLFATYYVLNDMEKRNK
jgi:signal peptidase